MTGYVPVQPGYHINLYDVQGQARHSMRFITAYNSMKQVLSSLGAEQQLEYEVPDGVYYLRISFSYQWYSVDNHIGLMVLSNISEETAYFDGVKSTIKPEALPEDYDARIDNLEQSMGSTVDLLDEVANITTTIDRDYSEVVESITWQAGYVTPDGAVYPSSSLYCYGTISVMPGDTVRIFREAARFFRNNDFQIHLR